MEDPCSTWCLVNQKVLKLKEELLEAEMKIQRLLERDERVVTSSNVNDNNNSPSSSSQSMETVVDDPPFLGDFGVEGHELYDDDMFIYTTDQDMNSMEWFQLYM